MAVTPLALAFTPSYWKALMSQDRDSTENIPAETDSNDDHISAVCTSLQFHLEQPTAEALDKRMKAVCHPDTDPKVLEHIASSAPHFLVKRVAEHPRAEAQTLDKLARHEHHEVRCALADNPNIILELQWQLAEDEHPDVRFAVAQSYFIDKAILSALTEDENPFVAHRARTTLQRLDLDMKKTKKTHTLPENTGSSERRRFRAFG